MSRHVYPTSGLLRLFTSALPPMFSAASSWAGDLRRPSQHSASHLSDRCLPPKQWIITALHLSGCTHLVWSAAFFASVPCHGLAPAVCLPSNFFLLGHGTQMLCLCLALSVCVRLFSFFLYFFPNPCFFSPLFSLTSFSRRLLLAESLTQTPQSNEQADYVRGKRADKKKRKKRMFYHQGNKGRSNLSSSLFGVMTECLRYFSFSTVQYFFGAYFHQACNCSV